MDKKFANVAFVLGESINALGVVKALGRKAVPVYLIQALPDPVSAASRYAQTFQAPDIVQEPEAYLAFLEKLAAQLPHDPVLLPTTDVAVMFIDRYRKQLETRFKFNIPSSAIIQQITSKEGFYELAVKYQLPVPQTVSAKSLEDAQKAAETLQFPCAIKPYYSHVWRTAEFRKRYGRMQIVKVNTPDELLQRYEEFAQYDPRLVIQEFIQGSDDCEYSLHTYVSKDQKFYIHFLAHKIRLEPIHHGSAAFIETAHNDQIFHLGETFLKNIGYQGMSSFQFKWDPVREKYFAIELNPRFSLWNYLEPSCGVNYPFINYLDSLGETFEVPPDYQDGVKWFSIERDVNAFLAYRQEGSLTFWNWIKSYRGPKFCAEFSWDDPKPFLKFLGKYVPRVFRAIKRKLIK